VNFVGEYTWERFQDEAKYLRGALLKAYGDVELDVETVTLRYRNGAAFEYTSSDVLGFLKGRLNTSIALPQHIPGCAGSTGWPSGMNAVFTFVLQQPKGTGVLRLFTGGRTVPDPLSGKEVRSEMLLWQLEVTSGADDAPRLTDEAAFGEWLTLAHSVAHEWFFSLVDGPLRTVYAGESE